MKKNNNGFILIETLVVSSFIISTLVFLYVQFINLKKNYDQSFRYDTISGLYEVKTIDKFINDKIGYGDILNNHSIIQNGFVELYNDKNDKNDKDNCNLEYMSSESSMCDNLMDKLNIKTLLVISNNPTKFKEFLKTDTTNKYSQELYLYTKNITEKKQNTYLLLAEFKDNTFASLDIKNVVSKVILYIEGKYKDSKSINDKGISTFELSESDISSSTNVVCNNGSIPSFNNNSLTVKNVLMDTECYFNSSMKNSVIKIDDSKNRMIMIKNENFSNQVVIRNSKKLILDLSGKTLTYNASKDEAMILNQGNLTINDQSGSGTLNTNFRMFKNEGTMTINNGIYSRENSDSIDGGIVQTTSSGKTIINDGTFKSDNSWVAFTFNQGSITINDGEFYSKSKETIVNNDQGSITINDGEFYSKSNATIVNRHQGNLTINDGKLYSISGATIVNKDQGNININGGIIYSNSAQSTISNDGSKVINLNSKKRIYVANFNDSSEWGARTITNRSTGTINIKGSKSDACNENIGINNEGICAYSYYRTVLSETYSTGTINIDGMTVVSKSKYAISIYSGTLNASNSNITGDNGVVIISGNNEYTGGYGTINLCNNTINGKSGDIFATKGLVKYKSDNVLVNKTINSTTTVKLDNTITCK